MERINKEKKSVSKKLKQTTKETEKLKQELEILMTSGVSPLPLSDKSGEKSKFKTPINQKSEKAKREGKKKNETELRKQKLKELQEKASKIVQKNVEAKKRAHSKHVQPQGCKIRSKSSSNMIESYETNRSNSPIASGNSAKPVRHLRPEQLLEVFHDLETNLDTLKKAKSEEAIPAAAISRKSPIENLHWLQERGETDHLNLMHIVTKELKFTNRNLDPAVNHELYSNQCGDSLYDGTDTSRDISSLYSESEKIKKKQGAIPKRLMLSDPQPLQLRNVTLRHSCLDLEKGFPTDFSNSEFSSTKQNLMFSVQSNRLEEDTTMKQAGCSVNQLIKTSAKTRKLSRELELTDKSANTELSEKTRSKKSSRSVLLKNITIKDLDISQLNDRFELELHLLIDFNESIQRLSQIEKTYESFRTNNVLKNQSFHTQITEQSRVVDEKNEETSEMFDWLNSENIWLNLTQSSDSTSHIQLEETSSEKDQSLYKGAGGVHLKIFERMIKEEDDRIENWKKMLKVQEQALLDRTRGELFYLEMQRKQLIETGKMAAASSIKKKQRGILLKHQQERMEMKRLKQMQKEESRNKKILLKKERNEIKEQLLSNKASKKVKRTTNQKKGPLKVLDSSAICSDPLISEPTDQEAASLTLSCMEITTGNDDTDLDGEGRVTSAVIDDVKKTLLMRERVLAKRRKTVEELLQWHKKLLEEEKAIEELEMKIRTIAIQAPTQDDKKTIPQREEQQSEVTSANYSLDFDVESGQPEEESSVSSLTRLMENVNKVQDNILNSSVSFKSSVESLSDKDNIPDQVEEQVEESVIHVEEHTIIEENSDDSKSSEGLEEASYAPRLSPKPSVSVEDVVEEAGTSSPSQQSFENKTDEEKAASLSGKSQKVPPITEILDEEDGSASSDVSTVKEEASVDDQSNPILEQQLMSEEKQSSILTEAEELHRKQLAIEQEIKLLKEQQEKEAATPFYLREIPDKPPPPYTPPSKSKTPTTPSVIPKTKEECEQIIEYCVKIIHKAYVCGNLDNITISENTLSLIAKDIDKSCYKFVYDLCKEVATDHYNQLAKVAGPSWLQPEQKATLAQSKLLDIVGLKKLMQERVLTQLGFYDGAPKVENSLIKWSKKNRDQVDEALVQEMQREDASWTNLEMDSILVRDRMVNEMMEIVIQDTVKAFKEAMAKKMLRNPQQ